MITLENQKAAIRTEHPSVITAKQRANQQRKRTPDHDRFVIYDRDGVHIAKPGNKPKGTMKRGDQIVTDMPLEWKFYAYSEN